MLSGSCLARKGDELKKSMPSMQNVVHIRLTNSRLKVCGIFNFLHFHLQLG